MDETGTADEPNMKTVLAAIATLVFLIFLIRGCEPEQGFVMRPGIAEGAIKIVGGGIDGTPPAFPSSGALVSSPATSGVYWITYDGTNLFGAGDFLGLALRTYRSTDGGVTWAAQGNSTGSSGFFSPPSTDVLIGLDADGTNTRIKRSTDGGVNYSNIVVLNLNQSSASNFFPFSKTGSRTWLNLSFGSSNSRFYFSDDDGAIFTQSDTSGGPNFCDNGSNGILANGNAVIGSSKFVTASCTGHLRVTTNNGSSWSTVIPTFTGSGSPCVGDQNFSNAVFGNARYYIVCSGNAGKPILANTTDPLNWGATDWIDLPFTTPGALSNTSLHIYNDSVFFAVRDPSDGFSMKIWRSTGSSWVLIHNTGISQLPGNMVTVGSSIYIGTSTFRVYKLS